VNNVYFAGNTAGLTDDLLGVGSINAIESGILAARAIALGQDYATLIKPIAKDVKKLHEFRITMNRFNNEAYDKFISFIKNPCIQQFAYHNRFFRLHDVSPFIKLYNQITNNK